MKFSREEDKNTFTMEQSATLGLNNTLSEIFNNLNKRLLRNNIILKRRDGIIFKDDFKVPEGVYASGDFKETLRKWKNNDIHPSDAETTLNWIYKDISSEESRRKFLEILKEWLDREKTGTKSFRHDEADVGSLSYSLWDQDILIFDSSTPNKNNEESKRCSTHIKINSKSDEYGRVKYSMSLNNVPTDHGYKSDDSSKSEEENSRLVENQTSVKTFPELLYIENLADGCEDEEDDLTIKPLVENFTRNNIYHTIPKKNAKNIIQKTAPIKPARVRRVSCAEEINAQNVIIEQIKTALRMCKLRKKLCKSRERIEAEKMLLVETIKRGMLLNNSNNQLEKTQILADVRVKDLKFTIEEGSTEDFTYYYVCLLKCGIKVISSEIATPVGNTIKFEKEMTLKDVSPNVSLVLYYMKIENGEKYLNNKYTTKLNKILHKFFPKTYRCNNSDLECSHYSEFEMLGNVSIPKSTPLGNENFTLFNTPLTKSVKDLFTANVEIKPHLGQEMQGFLTVKGNSEWSKCWCSLKGNELLLHNFQTKNLTEVINLMYCTTAVKSLNNYMDSKTLILELQSPKGVRNTYFLTADVTQEINEWKEKLTMTFESLKCWNLLLH